MTMIFLGVAAYFGITFGLLWWNYRYQDEPCPICGAKIPTGLIHRLYCDEHLPPYV